MPIFYMKLHSLTFLYQRDTIRFSIKSIVDWIGRKMKLTLKNQTGEAIEISLGQSTGFIEPLSNLNIETNNEYIILAKKNDNTKHFSLRSLGLFDKYERYNASYCEYLNTKIMLPKNQKSVTLEISSNPFISNKFLKLYAFDVKGIRQDQKSVIYKSTKQRRKIRFSTLSTLFFRYGIFSLIGLISMLSLLINTEQNSGDDSLFIAIMATVFVGFGGVFLYKLINNFSLLKSIEK